MSRCLTPLVRAWIQLEPIDHVCTSPTGVRSYCKTPLICGCWQRQIYTSSEQCSIIDCCWLILPIVGNPATWDSRTCHRRVLYSTSALISPTEHLSFISLSPLHIISIIRLTALIHWPLISFSVSQIKLVISDPNIISKYLPTQRFYHSCRFIFQFAFLWNLNAQCLKFMANNISRSVVFSGSAKSQI